MSSLFETVLTRAQARMPATPPAVDPRARPLRDIRRAAYLSIADLAERSGVSTKTIVETELGRSVPRFRTIRKLSAALGVAPSSVAEFVPAPHAPPTAEDRLSERSTS